MARPADRPPEVDLSDLAIDREAEVPIYVQVAWWLRARIEDGTLAPGQRLPGVRELADALGINVNTARAVYQRIERTGLIESRQGSGTFVSRDLAAPSTASAGRIAAEAARQARARGVDPREVAAALYVSGGGEAAEQGARPETAARRRRLREQIGSLERALGEIEAEYAAILPPLAAGRRRSAGPALLSAQELEATRAELLRRLTDIQAFIEQRAARARARPPAGGSRTRQQKRPAAARKPAQQHREQAAPAAKARSAVRPTGRPAPAGT